MPVLTEHIQDTTYYVPYWWQCQLSRGVRLSEHPPREQTATTSLHQSSYVDSLTSRALIRTASGKGGRRNTETEATTRAWHEGLQKRRLFIYSVIDEDQDDNWWCYGGPFSVSDYLTGPQTMLTVIIILVLTRPRNCGTCSVGQIIRATLSKKHPWSGWSSAVRFQPFPLGPQHSQLWVGAGQGWKIPHDSDGIRTPDLPTRGPTR